MDYQELLQKKELYGQRRASIPKITLFTFEQAFEIEYTHNSTTIEGNTLSLIETKVLLEDGISIGGKSLREIYEAVNHRKAFRYVKECIGQGMPLDERKVKDIHALLMENIQVGGGYRDVQVYISGAGHMPPPPSMMYRQIKDFYADLSWNGKELNQVELAAWTHGEFVHTTYFFRHCKIGSIYFLSEIS
ncbi:MAG: Fic family protein [Lachnospiraceae bacterium]|nr:Fic family protein [Lachnospiraceae bacterium]